METFDWYQINFLESAAHIKSAIKKFVGIEPKPRIANEIAVCFQQGRMFFESAKDAPLQIKPLLIYYGMIGFAKGLVLRKNPKEGLETLVRKHGLKYVSENNAKMHELKVKIENEGTFQKFNDVISQMGTVELVDEINRPFSLGTPFDNSTNLNNKNLSLKDILSRLPSLKGLYKNTFQEDIKVLEIKFVYKSEEYIGATKLKVSCYTEQIFSDLESLKKFIKGLRTNYPFLEKWCFVEAFNHPEGYIFSFCNIDRKNIDEFSGELIVPDFFSNLISRPIEIEPPKATKGKVIELNSRRFAPNEIRKLKLKEIIPPLVNIGSIIDPDLLVVEPIEGSYLSGHSLQFLGMYLLSCLVRYNPQIWVNAISRRPPASKKQSASDRPVDDTALAIIEKFVDLTLSEFPKMIVEVFNRKSR